MTRATHSASRASAAEPVCDTPTVIGGYVLAVAKALEHYGVDSPPVMRSAGIPVVPANDPLVRIPVSAINRLLQRCSEVTGDACFGLTLGRFIHISNLHAFGHALAASATLLDFCRRVERYFRIASQADVATLSVGTKEVILRRRLETPLGAEAEDAFAAYVILAMRHMHRVEFVPLKVGFVHSRPSTGAGPYEELFRAPVSFDQPEVTMVFSRASLEQPLMSACAELAQINDNVATRYLALIEKQDVIAQVRQAIIQLLPSGKCSRDAVAEKLRVSPTTLQYKLTKQRTTFQDLLDETRRHLACSYVQQRAQSITEIALNVGFTDTSNFTRAFKRWTGVSPSDYRHRQAT